MHPHGIFYTNDMDGAYKGKFTDPGGFVQNGRTFQYVWEARPGTEGAWLYHDHGPMDPLPVFKGLFGPLIIRKPGEPGPDREFFLAFHSFTPLAPAWSSSFSCINGRAYAGNTPDAARQGRQTGRASTCSRSTTTSTPSTCTATAGPTRRRRDHRQQDARARPTSRPFEFVEDNPGRWFYHCHVFSHLHMGMNGWYIVSA